MLMTSLPSASLPCHSFAVLSLPLVAGVCRRFGETMIIGYECTRAKPYPDPYLEGLSKLGLPADACVAFEDSVNGVSSAVSAGLYTIGVGAGSSEKLRDVIGGGLCVTDYLDSQLCETLGLGKSSDSDR